LTPAPSLLLQLNYITPSGGGVLALVVVLDGEGNPAFTPGANSKFSFSSNSPFIKCILDIFPFLMMQKYRKMLNVQCSMFNVFLYLCSLDSEKDEGTSWFSLPYAIQQVNTPNLNMANNDKSS